MRTLCPDSLVQAGVDPDILGAHLLLSKLLDLLNSSGCAILEPNTVQPLVHVDGVLTGNDLAHGGATLLLSAWRHYYWYLTNEGIQYLRDYLHLPPEIVPATLKRQAPRETRPRASAAPRAGGDKGEGDT